MFQNDKEFLDGFDLGKVPDYYDKKFLEDIKFGFSVKRKYPENINFKPDFDENNNPKSVALIWVILRDKEEDNSGNIPLSLRIICFDLPNSFNSESKKNQFYESSKPVSLRCEDYFYFNKNKRIYLNKKKREYSENEILDYIFKAHCNTVHPIKGLKLKFKKNIRQIIDFILFSLISLLIFILEKVFLFSLDEYKKISYMLPFYDNSYGFKDFNKSENGNEKKIFGYSANKQSIILLCTLVLIASFGYHCGLWELKYFKRISQDNFLVIAHTIFALWLIEISPSLVFYPLLNKIIRIRAKWSIKPISL